MTNATVTKKDLLDLGFKPHQAKQILHDARMYMVKHGKTFWSNPRLEVAPRAIIEEVILGFSLSEGKDNDKD